LGPGFAGADAYAAADNNRRMVTAQTGATLTVSPAVAFPMESPAQRFEVVEHAVTYACSPDATNPVAGEIRRYWGYPIVQTQPTPPNGGSSAPLARDVSNCAFTYEPDALNRRNGVVGLRLELTQATPPGRQTVMLFQQVHVSNVP
jgi:MSHA biogenesis protein MshO